jgi:ribosome-associated translation inhibitor RaiA
MDGSGIMAMKMWSKEVIMTKWKSLIEGQIKQIAPSANDITIKIERDHGPYLSKIHLRMPGMVLHAQKKGQSLLEALNLTYEAIVKQVVKFKMKKCTKKKSRIWRWQEPLGPPF